MMQATPVIAHWDDVEGRRSEKGPMAATWQPLGDAAGAKGIGLNRVRGELEFAEPGERPSNVVAFDDLPLDEDGDKVLAAAVGAERSGLNWIRRAPGKRGAIPHCHSLESEALVVLEGGGRLELWPTPATAERGAERESHELRPGHVVGRPPGTR